MDRYNVLIRCLDFSGRLSTESIALGRWEKIGDFLVDISGDAEFYNRCTPEDRKIIDEFLDGHPSIQRGITIYIGLAEGIRFIPKTRKDSALIDRYLRLLGFRELDGSYGIEESAREEVAVKTKTTLHTGVALPVEFWSTMAKFLDPEPKATRKVKILNNNTVAVDQDYSDTVVVSCNPYRLDITGSKAERAIFIGIKIGEIRDTVFKDCVFIDCILTEVPRGCGCELRGCELLGK